MDIKLHFWWKISLDKHEKPETYNQNIPAIGIFFKFIHQTTEKIKIPVLSVIRQNCERR
ncbi:MAG: hypothetical protein ACI4CY_06200 [Candidatus Gastranaerophilaceae bacterium]